MSSLLADDPHWKHVVDVYRFSATDVIFSFPIPLVPSPPVPESIQVRTGSTWYPPLIIVNKGTTWVRLRYPVTIYDGQPWRVHGPTPGWFIEGWELWYPQQGTIRLP